MDMTDRWADNSNKKKQNHGGGAITPAPLTLAPRLIETYHSL